MNYIILDVEATDINPKEIIEIGAVKLNGDLEIIDSFQSFVKPTVNPKLSGFIKNLTKINQEDVDSANAYPIVHDEFKKWIDGDSIILTWGKDDKKFIRTNIDLHDLDRGIIKIFIDFQTKVTSILNHGNGLIGLKTVLNLLDMNQDGQHHRALDDATNTSKVFVRFFDQLGDLKDIRDKNIKQNIEEKNDKKIKLFNGSKFKINYKGYYKHLSKLSIFMLRKKLKMIEGLIDNELKKQTDLSGYLYVTLVLKRSCIRKTLTNKLQDASLRKAGFTIQQIEAPLKAINNLHVIKDKMIVVNSKYKKQFSDEMKIKIEKLRVNLKKINKPSYTQHSKVQLVAYYEEILSLINLLLQSKCLKPKYIEHVTSSYLRVQRHLNRIQPKMQKVM